MANSPIELQNYYVKFWKGVIYAAPGIGKSVFACTSQKYRTFVFDCDEGMSSVKAWLFKHNMKDDLVRFWPVKSYADFLAGYTWFVKNQAQFDLVVIDSATELQRIVKGQVTTESNHKVADQRDWGAVLDAMEFLVSNFKHGDFHMVVLAHEIMKANPITNIEEFRPSFQGAFKTEYAKHFSYIARYQLWWVKVQDKSVNPPKIVPKMERWLNFGPDPSIHFKDRSGVLAHWEQPNIDVLLDKMIASQGSKDDLVKLASATVAQPEAPAIFADTDNQNQNQNQNES